MSQYDPSETKDFHPVGTLTAIPISLQFDGVSDHVDLGNPAEFNFVGDFTLSTWVKLNGNQTAKYIISKYDFPAHSNGSYGLGTAESSEAYGFVWGSGPFYEDLRGTFSLNDGQWHAISFVYERGNSIRLYVDGNLSRSAFVGATPPFVNATPLYLGATFSGQNFGGAMDDVRISDTALSNEEIADLYAQDIK